jgi:hypothetical protein
MRLMSPAIFIVMLVVATGAAVAQAQQADAKTRQEQVAAATSNAVASLRDQIAQQSMARNLTVGEFLNRTEGNDALNKTLQRAEQIGGPRWVDDQTCQVRLEITGQRVADALAQIAAVNPKTTPLPADVVAVRMKDLRGRRFGAIGSSTGGATVEDVRPPQRDEVWAGVSDDARKQALSTAKRNAITRVLDSIRPIRLAGDDTVGTALALPAVERDVTRWLSNRPVTRVEFGDDRQVDLTLSAEPTELFDVFKASAQNEKSLALPLDDKDWQRVRREFEKRMAPPTGHGVAPSNALLTTNTTTAMAAPRGQFLQMPSRAPEWATRRVDVEGTSADVGSRLKTARAAEKAARQRLRAQLDGLTFDGNQTLGNAASQDERIVKALQHAVHAARVTNTDYRVDGSVAVRVSADAEDLWNELSDTR